MYVTWKRGMLNWKIMKGYSSLAERNYYLESLFGVLSAHFVRLSLRHESFTVIACTPSGILFNPLQLLLYTGNLLQNLSAYMLVIACVYKKGKRVKSLKGCFSRALLNGGSFCI